MKSSRSKVIALSAVLMGTPFVAHAGLFDSFFDSIWGSIFGNSNPTPSKPTPTQPSPTPQPTKPTPQPIQNKLNIIKMSGDTSSVSGSSPKTALVFKVVDQNNKPVANAPLNIVASDKLSQVFLKTTTTDANGLIEATWVAGRTPNQTLTISTALNGATGSLTLSANTTEIARPWGMSNTYMFFDRPKSIALDSVKGYKFTIIPGTEALGTYYEVMGFPGSYAGLQMGNTGVKQVLYSTWDIDELGDKGKAKTINAGASTCKVFGGEGTGGSCSMPLAWQIGKAYEFAMTYKNGIDETGQEYTDSTLTVTDIDAKRSYDLGTHRYAKKVQVDQIYMFVEDFKRDRANCWDMPKRKLSVSDAQILQTNGVWTPLTTSNISLYNGDKSKECFNVNGGVEKDSNGKNRWFMASADEIVSNPYRNLQSVKLN